MSGRWDTFTWDDNTVWDAVSADDLNLFWGIEIDWNGDGVFDGQNEAVNCVSLIIERGRQSYIRLDGSGDADGFAYIEPGTCNIVLDNSSGRYTPRNAASPIYPNIRPGRFARVTVTYNSVTYARFAGRVIDIRVVSPQRVSITMIDGMREISERDTSVALQKTLKISDAIGMILDDVVWPVQWGRSIDTTGESLPYWWTTGQRALSELRSLADADTGQFFCNAEGAATFVSRNHSGATAATLTEADLLKEILLPNPWEVIRNDIRITAQPRTVVSAAEVWQLGEVPFIAAGETKYYFATTAYSGADAPVDAVITPVASTDYSMNTLPDGSGVDWTAYLEVDITPMGSVVMIRVNNFLGDAAYITLLKLRADAIIPADAVSIQRTDASSQATYGTLKFNLASLWLQSLNTIESLGDWLKTYLPISGNFPAVQIENRPDLQFAPDLFDNVDATLPTLGLNSATYRVAYIREEWLSSNGQSVRTELHLEPFAGLPVYWIFDATMEVTTIFPP